MKKIEKIVRVTVLLTLFLGWGLLASAQSGGTPPPPPNGGHGLGNNQPANGGSAPIGGGLAILLSLGAAYGGRKVYCYWKEQKEGLEE